MNSEDYLPTELLRPFIKTYKIIESKNETVNRILPSTSVAMAFRFRGQTNYIEDDKKNKLPSAIISGLRKSVRLINYESQSATFVVIFKEGGAKAFFREPIHELFEESISLENFVSPGEVAPIEDQLAEAGNNNLRVIIVEQFLLSRLAIPTPDQLIATAIEKINSTKGTLKISELTQSLYISMDAFEKRFRKTVGTSPKQFSTIVRLQSIARQGRGSQLLTNLALDAGYFDQSHFNKDFKLFTGQSPADFFKSNLFW